MLPLDESAHLADTSISGPAACAAAGEHFPYLPSPADKIWYAPETLHIPRPLACNRRLPTRFKAAQTPTGPIPFGINRAACTALNFWGKRLV